MDEAKPERAAPVGRRRIDEAERVAIVRELGVLDSPPDPRFNRIASLAALIFDAPLTGVVLVDSERLWLKAAQGLEVGDHVRRGTLTEVALALDAPVFCGDVKADPAFAAIDVPTADGVRFFASAPLVLAGGTTIGALVVADHKPRAVIEDVQRRALIDLAALATEELIRDAEAVASRRRHDFDLERLNLALDAANLRAYEWDLGSDALMLGERLCELVGAQPEDADQDPVAGIAALIHPDDRETALASIDRGLTAQGRYEVEHRMHRRTVGGEAWVASSGVLVRNGPDDPGRIIGVIQDVTQRKVAEQQRETLLGELDHRIKNLLSAVQSLAAQSARKATSLDGFLKTFAGRLKSMASAHQLLTATRWRGAALSNVAAAELAGIAPGQTRWEGPEVLLIPRAANAVSLALHELAINAVKFGALSVESGRVDLRWLTLADGGLELRWTESHGPLVSPPVRRGFGATLLEKVTGRELDGDVTLEYRREGLTAVIRAGAAALQPAATEPASAGPDLPPDPPEEAAPPSLVNRPARIDGLRVLIVEDALLLALELEAGLQEAGAITVGCAADVDEAMSMINLPLDAAVLDANLNGASVMPVAEALAARGIPFVFATGYGDNRFSPAGFDAPVIRKPYDVTQVAAALAEVTGRV